MWLLLEQFAKKKQRAAQAAAGANRPTVELARPRIFPHPVAGTIEFERGQIVAKVGRYAPRSERIISTGLRFAPSTGATERRDQVFPKLGDFIAGLRSNDPGEIVSFADIA
jgi:hypothetical protein